MADTENKNNRIKGANQLTWEDVVCYLDSDMGILLSDNMRAAMDQYMKHIKAGEPWALKDLLDRRFGKPKQSMDINVNDPRGALQNSMDAIDKKIANDKK